MSMRSYYYNGFGLQIKGELYEKIRTDVLKNTIQMEYPEFYEDIPEAMGLDGEEFVEAFEDWYTNDYGCNSVFAFLAETVSKNDNVRIDYFEGENAGDEAIMLTYSLPWVYNDTERKLTETELALLFSKWFDMYLGIDIPPIEFGEVEVEMYG